MSETRRGNSHTYRGRGENSHFRGRGENSHFRGRDESSHFRGRDESSHFRGRGESAHFRGRGESAHFRGRGESSHFRGRGEGNFSRDGRKSYPSEEKDENQFDKRRGQGHFNRGREEIFSFSTKHKELQNDNQIQQFNYGLGNFKQSKEKYCSNENISTYKRSNSNTQENQLGFNSLSCAARRNSNQVIKNENSVINKIVNNAEEFFGKGGQNLDLLAKKKEKKRKYQKHKKTNMTEQNRFLKYSRNTNLNSNMKTKQPSIPDLLSFVRKFSEKLFEFNDEEESVDNDLHCNLKDNNGSNLKYQIPKKLRASNSTLDDDKSDIYDIVSDDSSYLSDSFDETETNFNDSVSMISNKNFTVKPESYIGVYWDIENCPVPNKKLASDLVKKVRNKFYGKCTEAEFIVSCDIRNISDTIVTDLNDAQVTVVHVDCLNKNAADNKLKVCLRRFAESYRQPNSRIVLISGDCDFVPELHDLRYRHQIKVIILHNIQAKKNLIDVANIAEEFTEFCKDLPNYEKLDKHIVIQNLPMNKKQRGQIRTFLTNILKGYNYNYLKINNGNAEVGFKSDETMKKALSKLNEINIFGKNISAKEIECTSKVNTEKVCEEKVQENEKPEKIQKKIIKIQEPSSDSTNNKEFKLILQVEEPKNKLFWQKFFTSIFPKIDFKIKDINEQQKLITLAFESLNKSKKALKIINKHRTKEMSSPKIQIIISNEKENTTKIDSTKEIVSKCLKLIDSKQNQSLKIHFINKEKFFTENISSFHTSESNESECQNVTENRLKIMNQQKSEFLNYIKNQKVKLEEYSNLPNDTFIKLTDKIKTEIEDECHLFLSENPAYSKKSAIINILEKNNICILHTDNCTYNSTEICHYILQTKHARSGIVIHIKPNMKISKNFQDNEKIFDLIKQKNNSSVISVTDYSFLKYFLSNKTLKNIKCIVFDTVEERCLYTEILLLLLKQIPISERNFKLLFVTSDISVIENYFPVNKEVIIDFGKWNYPVNVVWKENNIDTCFNYIQDSIEYIMDICEDANISGNILIFLASVLDIQQAAFLLERFLIRKGINEFELIQFHELQDEKEQRDMLSFNKDKRKIIFSTDYGRIYKLMPSVQCVIDCGFVLKEVYSSCNASCEIWKKFQSKHSSEMRKNCAGSNGPGICYCLFSEVDYKEKMNNQELSDLYHCDLSHLFLLFLQHEINPFKFNYGENISADYLSTFKKKLIQLNAIKDDKLTEIGNQMSKLNFDTSVAKLIIRGYEEGIPFEMSTLAALAIISGYVSFQQDSNEQTKQWRFSQINGDWKSFHTMYTEWLSVPKKSKNYWCQLNKINVNTMKIFHELSNSITMHASKICKKKTPSDKTSCDIKIQKLLLEAYPYNLCFYSNQINEGYQNIFYPNHLFIHSLSTMKHLGIFPEFIVYQKIYKSSDSFVLGVNSIDEEVLIEMEKSGNLPVSVNDLKMKILVSMKISNLSLPLLKSLMGKNKQNLNLIERKLRSFVQDDISRIEINTLKGEVIVYTNKKNIDNVKTFMYETLQNEKDKMLNIDSEVFIDGYLRNIRLIIGSGVEVKDVMMLNESRNVCIKSNKPLDDILSMLEDCGKICNYGVNKKGINVTFDKAAFAENAIKKFSDETNFKISYSTSINLSITKPPPLVMMISWLRRPCSGIGFINFNSEEELCEMFSKLSTFIIEVKGRNIRLQINKKKKDSLLLKELPEETMLRDIESAIKALNLSDFSYKSIVLTRKKPYASLEDEIEMMETTLHDCFAKYTKLGELEVDMEKPKETSVIWKATLSFTNALDGFTAMASMKDIQLKGSQAKLNLSFIINCHSNLFYCIKSQIDESLKTFNTGENIDDTLEVVAKPFGDLVSTKIQSNNINDMIKVKTMIFDILEGKCITGLNKTQINNISTNCGAELTRDLCSSFHLHIQTDCIKKKISICGDPQKSQTAKSVLKNFLNDSKPYKHFELVGEDIPGGALCVIAKSYGYDLKNLRSTCNLEELKFNFDERSIMACGNEASIKKLETTLNKLYKSIQKNLEQNDELNEICPICLGVRDESFYGLSGCEHVFCKPCLSVQIQNGNLPLICQNSNCGRLFIWDDVKTIIGKNKILLQDLLMRAFIKHVEENSEKYLSCPTIGCYYVHKMYEEIGIFHCPGCENDICTRCRTIYHYGMSCEMFWSINEDKKAIELWILNDPKKRKCCTNCNACLENTGENIVIGCWKCGNFNFWN